MSPVFDVEDPHHREVVTRVYNALLGRGENIPASEGRDLLGSIGLYGADEAIDAMRQVADWNEAPS